MNWLHWADSVIELPCPDVCLSVCVFVNLDPQNYFFKTCYKHFLDAEKNVTPNKNLYTPSKKMFVNHNFFLDHTKEIADWKKEDEKNRSPKYFFSDPPQKLIVQPPQKRREINV